MKRSRLDYLGDDVSLFEPRKGLLKKIFGPSKKICSKCRAMYIDENMWRNSNTYSGYEYICTECAYTKNDAVRYFFHIGDLE